MLPDLLHFVQSIFLRWSNLVTGGLVALAWLAYEKFTGRQVPVKAFIAILAVGLFIAVFSAWREEYLKTKVPKLKAFLETTVAGQRAVGDEFGVAVLIEIRNSGPPTTPTEFEAKLEYDCKTVPLLTYALPPDLKFQGPNGWITMKQSEMIYEKTLTPIVQGGYIAGWLWLIGKGNIQEIYPLHPKLMISFKDSSDIKYSVTSNIGGKSGPRKYIPGVDNPFQEYESGPIMQPSSTPGKGVSPP